MCVGQFNMLSVVAPPLRKLINENSSNKFEVVTTFPNDQVSFVCRKRRQIIKYEKKFMTTAIELMYIENSSIS